MDMARRIGRCCRPFVALLALCGHAAVAFAQLQPGEDATATLARADANKTSDHQHFVDTLVRLENDSTRLTEKQRAHLQYLEAWQVAYAGDYDAATPLLETVAGSSPDKVLRFRATATLINILGIGHRYQEAFSRLTELTDMLPAVTDPQARVQGLGEAAQMLATAGQYDLAADYAERMIQSTPAGDSACKGTFIKLHAMFRGKRIDGTDDRYARGIADCQTAGENLIANALRADVADTAIRNGQPRDAIHLLESHYADVLRYGYPSLTSQVESLLAQAYWNENNSEAAGKYASAAVKSAPSGEYSEPLAVALRTLYLIARKQGDFQAATQWLERYMQADKGYLDDVSASALAYQMVKQQVVSSRMEADALDRQNQILHLQREVDRRSIETSRLYIVLLLTVASAIALWLIRTKRAQLRFMRMARRDSLTGICNRQHFVERAQQALLASHKAGRASCLILFDLDHFKLVNDTYGHSEGDWVLLRVVAECRDHLLQDDVFGRLGGEEFAILLPGVDEADGARRAELIRAAIAAPPAGGPSSARVTASFGVACTRRHGADLDRLLVVADEALYEGKSAGRDRVVVAVAHSDAGKARAPMAPLASKPLGLARS
ncbi:GGDEF domain-containing protein [Luteibacter sp. SG786]|uniref:tetratricopeptide repeat-containing diguanylate cyclase n=1 Tax=Luteibacter sp. SG786 TaxID=2587130 RepID=UPI001421009B|nr:GGDEF domain-containing protein [Luteibacter sp. SG786]NII55298.1 diguanylate cyclase (GGDEF)-like protein [Luteibacter sp. SG786]